MSGHEIDPAAFVRVHALEDQHRVIGNVLDALNQPLAVFLLLVGTGGFLLVGELQTIARQVRRKAGEGGAPERATSVGSSGLGRRYRLTLLFGAGLLLASAFGTTSASFSSQILTGGVDVNVDFPTITPTPTPTPTATPTATPTPTPTPTTEPTLAPTATPTLAPTATPTLAPTDTPTDALTPAQVP